MKMNEESGKMARHMWCDWQEEAAFSKVKVSLDGEPGCDYCMRTIFLVEDKPCSCVLRRMR